MNAPALPLEAEFEETNYSRTPLGEASKSCCKVGNGNVCGSGSIVGVRNGKSLVLTNAHVAGTRIGHRVVCEFPFANKRVSATVVMAGYSDRIMMDWAVLECDEQLDLKCHQLSIETPSGEHYTGGYPRCQGPYFQRLVTREIIYSGTVWKWSPNSIGGQSGSGVHSFANDLQFGLLTWSWGGYGAGQTTRSIWYQYVSRTAIGVPRPDGLIELCDNRADGLEEGVFFQSNITTLPIWDHLNDDVEPPTEPADPAFLAAVKAQAESLQKEVDNLTELVRKYEGGQPDGGRDGNESTGPRFGL